MSHLHSRRAAWILAACMLLNQAGCQMGALQVSSTVAPVTAIDPIDPRSLPLSGRWSFAIDRAGIGEAEGWMEAQFDDSDWHKVDVPHTWNAMPEYSHYDGHAWYRKSVMLPAEAAAGHVRLRFEAIYYLARVWLNGTYLGRHEGGYTPFEFDATASARPGQENLIVVEVDNIRAPDRIPAVLRPGWSFDWWNYGGITRDVSLEITSRAYIAQQRIVSVPDLSSVDAADSATVTATLTVRNTSTAALDGVLQANLQDEATGQALVETAIEVPVSVSPGAEGIFTLTATLAAPKLWHFDHPNLYRWTASLYDAQGRQLDARDAVIGIRLVELKDGGFYLNGERMRLAGLTRHADSPGQGAAETVTVMLADHNDLKTLNEVFTRPVHYPQPEFILDYADRHGILLIPEVPAWQLTESQMYDEQMRELEKSQLREMIAENFNHPSVWAWSVGNEIESDTASGRQFVEEMIAYVKSLDPTRPVGFASNRLGARPWFDATALSDFVLMNQYFGTWAGPKQGLGPALDLIHQTWPEKTVIISEYGFEPNWNELVGLSNSELDPEQYYLDPDGDPYSALTDDVRGQVITDQMEVFRSRPFVAAAIFWTYQDYRTPTNFVMGVVDEQRNRRGAWEVLRTEYAPALMESLAMSTADGGKQTAHVRIRTRGPVESDMPAYTLRGYILRWSIESTDGNTTFAEGDQTMPDLAPGSTWSAELDWNRPAESYVLNVSVVRPTGFAIFEHRFDPEGRLLP